MAIVFKSLVILPLLFVASYAQLWLRPDAFEFFNLHKILGPHELFNNPFGDAQDYRRKRIDNDFGTEPLPKSAVPSLPSFFGLPNEPKGSWELVSVNSGVSAMHSILLPKVNKVLMYDATIWKKSEIRLPAGHCRLLNKTTGENDCYCHSVLFDIATSAITPLELHTDTWCSSGGLSVDGNLVGTGGFQGGAKTVRYLETCQGCNWREFPTALADRRWYSTQAELPDGGFIVVGGRDAFSYEYIPREGRSNAKSFFFDFLRKTSDKDENNLYPFVHLSTDGNLFIFANDRSVLLNPKSNQVVRELPALPGGHRSYPATGMSVLLPIKLHSRNNEVIPAEVLVCGGSGHRDAYTQASKDIFYTALEDCGRIRITDAKPVWKREIMPSPRVMGDMMILPTGDVLLLNGAKRGCSGWGFAREPNLIPAIYHPKARLGNRFRALQASTIPRMYHSSSVVLPDGKILVAGSNTNNGYVYNAMFPTELRVEKFSPPYLDPSMIGHRPVIIADRAPKLIAYNSLFRLQFRSTALKIEKEDIKVTMYAPSFTTHGVAMNQRLIDLGLEDVITEMAFPWIHTIKAVSPPSGRVAPPGYYMLFVVHQGVPSVATWVQIK
uniref:Galactose oxidase-like Early set domain-containing protein n=1 Tax=Salix viminalis TaxID=40686 RepID=A0A6N2KNI2_SALVM